MTLFFKWEVLNGQKFDQNLDRKLRKLEKKIILK